MSPFSPLHALLFSFPGSSSFHLVFFPSFYPAPPSFLFSFPSFLRSPVSNTAPDPSLGSRPCLPGDSSQMALGRPDPGGPLGAAQLSQGAVTRRREGTEERNI